MFDPRYLLLTSKERKQVFEKYVKERAEEERREKRNKMKERKEQFQKLLEEAGLHGKYVEIYQASVEFSERTSIISFTSSRIHVFYADHRLVILLKNMGVMSGLRM